MGVGGDDCGLPLPGLLLNEHHVPHRGELLPASNACESFPNLLDSEQTACNPCTSNYPLPHLALLLGRFLPSHGYSLLHHAGGAFS